MNWGFGWGAPNTTDGPSQRYNRQFWDAHLRENETRFSRMNEDSKEDLVWRINEPCMRFCYYELNYFGDPELEIEPVNQPPIMDPPPHAYIDSYYLGQEGKPFAITPGIIDAKDPNPWDPITVSMFSSPPCGATLTQTSSSLNPSRVEYRLDWPFAVAGTYNVIFTARDLRGGSSSKSTIIDINAAPIIDPSGILLPNYLGQEGQPFEIPAIEAMDADGDSITISSSTLPAGAKLTKILSSSGPPSFVTYEMTWDSPVPGTYTVEFIADDGRGGTDSTNPPFPIVIKINAQPILDPGSILLPSYLGQEGQLFEIPAVIANDLIDLDSITISSSFLPAGATFTQVAPFGVPGYVVYKFRWASPVAGTYNVVFTADDGNGGTDSNDPPIIIDINAAPVIDPSSLLLPSYLGQVGTSFEIIDIIATDADLDNVTISMSGLPNGSGAGLTLISQSPGSVEYKLEWGSPVAGTYSVTLTADDGRGGTDSKVIRIEINTPPVLDPQNTLLLSYPGQEGVPFSIPSILAVDDDGDSLTMRTSGLPIGATMVPTPSVPDAIEYELVWSSPVAGTYSVEFIVDDARGGVARKTIAIEIEARAGAAPVLDLSSASCIGQEGVPLEITGIIATDVDGDPITISSDSLPHGATLTPVSFSYVPPSSVTYKIEWASPVSGIYTVILTATDARGGISEEELEIRIYSH